MHGSAPRVPLRRVSIVAMRPLFAELRGAGLAVDDVLARVGLAADALGDDRRLPYALTDAIWAEAARHRPDLPLRVAATAGPASYGLLTYLLAAAPNVGAALRGLVRRYALLGDATTHRLELSPSRARLVVELRGEGRPACVEAFAVAVVVCFLRRQCGASFRPRLVALRGAGDPRVDSRPFFGAEVEHASTWCGFEIDRRALDLPLASAEPGLHRLLDEHADHVVSSSRDDLVDRVRDVVRMGGARADAHQAEIAAMLGMSERTLRRQLAGAGRTFRDVLDEALADHAQRLLVDRTVDDVASELGYADPSAFRRAWRRWYGGPPRLTCASRR
jgi:AraC-like DNA-binding protein